MTDREMYHLLQALGKIMVFGVQGQLMDVELLQVPGAEQL